jgi:PPP family 3-phenylpropionic acid transporter
MKKFTSFSYYVVFFAAQAAFIPFIVLYYQQLGFDGAQIGLLTGVIPLITLVAVPLWTRLADATRKHRLIMSVAMSVGVAGFIIFPMVRTFAPLLLLGVAINSFLSPASSFADSATMFMLGDQKDLYGRIRIGGTIGFGVMAPIAGLLVENLGLKMAFWGAAFLFFLGLLISQKFEYAQGREEDSEKGGIRTLLENPHWLLFLSLAFAAGLSLAATSTYFYPYMKELGVKESIMGVAVAVGTLTEIPTFFFGDRLLKRFGSYRLLLVAMVMNGVRPLLFAVSGSVIPILLIQLLNVLAFPATWLAGVAYADENAPMNLKTTAQGLFSMMFFGVGMAAGGFFGGLLLESIGGQGMFALFGGVVLGVTFLVALIKKSIPAEKTADEVGKHQQ